MTNKQQQLFNAMDNYVEHLRAYGNIVKVWDSFSPEVKKAVTILTTNIKMKSLEDQEGLNK